MKTKNVKCRGAPDGIPDALCSPEAVALGSGLGRVGRGIYAGLGNKRGYRGRVENARASSRICVFENCDALGKVNLDVRVRGKTVDARHVSPRPRPGALPEQNRLIGRGSHAPRGSTA
jgi:hypothetical protein